MTGSGGAPLFPICESGRWGFINGAGEVVIPPRFANARPFSEGLARVDIAGAPRGEEQGIINTNGELVIPPGPPKGVERACRYADDWAWSYGDFSEGLASLWVNDATGLGGYIDTRGVVVVQPRFKKVCDFGEGLAFVVLPDPDDPDSLVGEQSAFVDSSGTVFLHSAPFCSSSSLREGRCQVSVQRYDEPTDEEDSLEGYVDRTGKLVIAATYLCADEFAAGLACVRQRFEEGGYFGFVDPQGNTAVPFDLDQCSRHFGLEGVIYGVRAGEWVLVDRHGEVLAAVDLDPSAYVGDVVDGRASATVEVEGVERCGFLDSQGKLAIPLIYDSADDFRDGLAHVGVGDLRGYIDRDGKFVWQTRAWTSGE